MTEFNFGDNQKNTETPTKQRFQLEYPLDQESEGALKTPVRNIMRDLQRVQALTIPAGATSFEVRGERMELTGAAAVTIATIAQGYNGQVLTLYFTDTNITITDDASGNQNTVNLSAAFTSTANDVLQLLSNGTSWREVSRSVN